MLPDFRSAKRKLDDHLAAYMRRAEARAMGYFAQVPRQRAFEGNRFSYETVDGKIVTEQFVEFSETFQLTTEETRSADMGMLQQKIDEAVASLASQRKREVYELLDRVTTETGNVIDARGSFDGETIFKFYEMMEMEFDDKGEPIRDGFTLLVNPASRDAVVKAFSAFENDPEWKKKVDELIDKKREAWRDREARRKLV